MADWSDKEVEIVKEEHAKGGSCSYISKVLGEKGYSRSRNSVLGKVYRLGLQPTANKGRPANAPNPRITIAKARSRAPLPPVPRGKPYKGEGVPILEHKPGMCAFPIKGEGAETIFCGADVSRQSYCEDHYRAAYVPRSSYNARHYQQKLLRRIGDA